MVENASPLHHFCGGWLVIIKSFRQVRNVDMSDWDDGWGDDSWSGGWDEGYVKPKPKPKAKSHVIPGMAPAKAVGKDGWKGGVGEVLSFGTCSFDCWGDIYRWRILKKIAINPDQNRISDVKFGDGWWLIYQRLTNHKLHINSHRIKLLLYLPTKLQSQNIHQATCR